MTANEPPRAQPRVDEGTTTRSATTQRAAVARRASATKGVGGALTADVPGRAAAALPLGDRVPPSNAGGGRESFGLLRESARTGRHSPSDEQLTLFPAATLVLSVPRPATASGDAWRWVRPRSSRSKSPGETGATTGQLLHRRRVELRLTQTDLAQRLRVDQSVVSRVEHGGITLTLDDLCEWARALDADPVTLLGDEVRGDRVNVRRPGDRSLTPSTLLAQSVPAGAVDDVARVGVSVRRLVLARRSHLALLPAEARALIRAGFADERVVRADGQRGPTFPRSEEAGSSDQ